MTDKSRRCEKRSDEAIQDRVTALDCFASLVMTIRYYSAAASAAPTRPARTRRPGSAPVCSPRSKIGVPATQRRRVAVDALDEAPAAGGQVVDDLRRVQLQPVVIDQVDVGAQARRQPAAIGEAEEIGGLAGLALDQQLQRQARPARAVAPPVHQHVGRHAGIDDRGAMRAAVAQAEQARRIRQHLADRRVIAGDVWPPGRTGTGRPR